MFLTLTDGWQGENEGVVGYGGDKGVDASKLVCFIIMITTLPGLYLSCAWTKTPLFPTTVSLQRQYLKTNLFRSRFSSKNIQIYNREKVNDTRMAIREQ